MERLIDYLCEMCGELEEDCSCYFSDYVSQEDNKDFKFEYSHEHLTSENSIFRRNMPIK